MYRLLMLIASLPTLVAAQSSNPLLDKLDFGDYPTGYQFIEAYDLSRPPLKEQYKKEGRIVPVYFWYSSTEAPSSTMTFRSYLDDIAKTLGGEISEKSVSPKSREIFSNYHFDKSDSIIDAYMGLEILTNAGRDLAIAKGKFPVVVFSHGDVDRWWIWGEYLASHGIAVVSAPNAGSYRKRHEIGLSGLETQIRDAQFAVSVVTQEQSIDGEQVFTAGSSYGSLTAAGFATRDPRVKGIISLDGIVADVNEGELLTETSYFNYQLFDKPILHLNSGFNWSSNYTIMDRWIYADQYRIQFENLRHSDYHFVGMADMFGCNFNGGELTDNSDRFKSLTDYVLLFINGLVADPKQLEKLTEKLEGVVKSEFIEGIGKAYSAEEILEVIVTSGFAEATKVYQTAKTSHPQPFSPSTFYEVGLTLHRYRMLEEETQWFQYYLESYPLSADAQYRLARLAALTGDPEEGALLLRKAKEMVPGDPYTSADRKTYLLGRIDYFLNR